ncbi:unnamed protein product, partial [Eretmochelys imbricata]
GFSFFFFSPLLFFFSFLGKSCDKGQSFLSEIPESPATSSYRNIIQRIQEYCGLKHSQEKLSNPQGME